MKMNKKMTAVCAFVVGAVVCTSAAFADVVVGSGYYGLKNAVKSTSAKLVKEVENFTLDADVKLKVDGEVVMAANEHAKVDRANGATESNSTSMDKKNGTSTYYSYTDDSVSISQNDETDTYYVYERSGYNSKTQITDPFEEDIVKDAEKVMDSIVGNLKDTIQVEEVDGKKMYMASLTDSQIPTVVNAVSSFVLKYGIMDNYTMKEYGLPTIESDLYLKDISGKAIENADGILESAIASGTAVGKDKAGTSHTLGFEITLSITNINQTSVSAPNLDGKKVEKAEKTEAPSIDEKYVGTYTNDIVKQQDGVFAKVGERTLEITAAGKENIAGSYTETYFNSEDQEKAVSFTFNGTPQDDRRGRSGSVITYTQDGVEKQGLLEMDYSGTGAQTNLRLCLDVTFQGDGGYSYDGDTIQLIRQF